MEDLRIKVSSDGERDEAIFYIKKIGFLDGCIHDRVGMVGTYKGKVFSDYEEHFDGYDYTGRIVTMNELRIMASQKTDGNNMKEYLVKDKQTGSYYVDRNPAHYDDAIEIPEGAIIAVHYNRSDKIYFWKDNETHLVGEVWVSCEPNGLRTIESFLSEHKDYCIVVWQRHTKPEELPFVDDNLSKVDETLKDRQSQYGSFEDVSFVTQGIIEIMSQCNYKNLPRPHQMALYMIASKMARLVNGDCNHLDSWHDIGGYAKLIENLIEGK